MVESDMIKSKKNIINGVVIVVPVYKKYMTLGEKISFQQLLKVLGKYNICLIIPHNLQAIYKPNNVFDVEIFDDVYFQNLASYSHLLMDQKFYNRFYMYKYMLIYQLDAFVFSDKLVEFISMDYDYIGAVEPKYLSTWETINNFVGNGGLSLRKISSMKRMIENKEKICKGHPLENIFYEAEDLFFSYCATVPQLGFAVPPKSIAIRFAVDYDISHCYRKLGKQLPFGCHGWNKRNFAVWKPIIEKYGYDLAGITEEDKKNDSYSLRWNYVKNYLIRRIIRSKDMKELKRILSREKRYSIWGYGKEGEMALRFLTVSGIKIGVVFDQCLKKINKIEDDIQFIEPSKVEICKKKSIIIITTTKYEEDVRGELEEYGLCKGKDFLLYRELTEEVVKNRYFYNEKFSFCNNGLASI